MICNKNITDRLTLFFYTRRQRPLRMYVPYRLQRSSCGPSHASIIIILLKAVKVVTRRSSPDIKALCRVCTCIDTHMYTYHGSSPGIEVMVEPRRDLFFLTLKPYTPIHTYIHTCVHMHTHHGSSPDMEVMVQPRRDLSFLTLKPNTPNNENFFFFSLTLS